MKQILSCHDLRKTFGGHEILRGISFEVFAGEITVLMGESGSGKTTLLRIAAGLEQADSGQVHLRGALVDGASPRSFVAPERRRLGMVFQDYALWPHMTAIENVAAALPASQRDRRGVAAALLAEVGLSRALQRRPEQLSGGQQQRVGLARALAGRPDLLLLDEPLSGLDMSVRDRMRALMRRLLKEHGTAALFVSHDPLDAWRLADRVLVLEHGRIVQDDPPQRLYIAPRSYRVARLMGFEGKYRVALRAQDAATGAALGTRFQPMTPVGLQAGQEGVALIRAEGVRIAAGGHEAVRLETTFESGSWRTVWRLGASGWMVTGLEPAPPPAEAHVSLDPAHILVFPLKSGSPS